MPSFNYRLRSKDSKASYTPPAYAFTNSSSATRTNTSMQCIVRFDIPADLQHTVLFYYKLTNFYQNHRRYVKSLDSDQLKGKYRKPSDLQNGDCKPLAQNTNGTKAVYPCGLIANSFFNGTINVNRSP